MKINAKNRRSLLFVCLLYVILFLGIIIFYFFNPFKNGCVRGDCENGYGVYLFHSEMKYEGQWENGKRHGKGTLSYPNGSQYTGEWKNNRMHGSGIKTYVDNHLYKYVGEWKNGMKNGKGTHIYRTGEKYVGEWENGKMHGHGTYKGINGSIHIGSYKNGQMNGAGITTYPDGSKIKGIWVNNRLTGSSDFYLYQFNGSLRKIEKLCSAVKSDVHLSLKAQDNTIAWLNELLKVPDFYEKSYNKTTNFKFPNKIRTLEERTRDFRHKSFSELDDKRQNKIKRLNRLLLEYLYPHQTPKSRLTNR